MGSRSGVDSAPAEIAALAARLVEADPTGSVLAHAGTTAAAIAKALDLVIDPTTTPIPLPDSDFELAPALVAPETVGLVYEQLLAVEDRRRRGAHFTPPSLAQRLIDAATIGWHHGRATLIDEDFSVVDPSCGGGVFLLAAARWMTEHGLAADQAATRLVGIDVAPDAVAVSQLSLALWLASQRATDEPIEVNAVGRFVVGDALEVIWPRASLVVGNPPFLSQLNSPTAYDPEQRAVLKERFGAALGAYTDPAWLFLLVAVEATASGGRIMLIQPTSLLSARDGTSVRAQLAESCDLVGLWLANERVFAAAVDVWAPVLEPWSDETRIPSEPALWVGARVEPTRAPPGTHEVHGPERWTSLCADVVGVPAITWSRSTTCIGDIATVTAGFRDQFYGFVPFTDERSATSRDPALFPPLVTVGMIDPLRLRWGTAEFRFAGTSMVEPVVDRQALAQGDASLSTWLDQRLRPKLLMATQTKVLEVVVDVEGTLVPATPCLSIEPYDDDPDTLWALAAILSSPALTVAAKRASMGAALSAEAIKVSAQAVAALPMPSRCGSDLRRGAEAARCAFSADNAADWDEALGRLAAAMGAAYDIGSGNDAVTTWWRTRRPAWR